MIDISKLNIGDRVCYQPEHYMSEGKWENGMVKEIPTHTNSAVRVVYNCAGDWDNFRDYTSALTNISDLTPGWKHEAQIEGKNRDNLYGIDQSEYIH